MIRFSRELVREFGDQAPGYLTAARSALLGLFLVILRDPGVLPLLRRQLRPDRQRESFWHVFRYVDAHYMESITVAGMAQLAGMSRSHFHAVFREETGKTLVEHVTETRVKAAQRLLRETDTPILQIAFDCGFASLSHFYHVFKARTGKTPRQMRHTSVSPKYG